MRPRNALILGALLCFATLMALGLWLGDVEVTPEELSQRCAQSRPEWPRYQEDIKGQIGAKPVAAWQGKPIAAKQENGRIEITFQLSQPWSQYQAAMPILLRDPLGNIHRPESINTDGDTRIYLFNTHPDNAQTMPWLEIRFPRNELRLALNAQGQWQDS